jgi:hypothetical protein
MKAAAAKAPASSSSSGASSAGASHNKPSGMTAGGFSVAKGGGGSGKSAKTGSISASNPWAALGGGD